MVWAEQAGVERGRARECAPRRILCRVLFFVYLNGLVVGGLGLGGGRWRCAAWGHSGCLA